MPEMIFRVQWPDGEVYDCYSPSLVVQEHLSVGAAYPVAEFARISRAARFAGDRAALVRVVTFA